MARLTAIFFAAAITSALVAVAAEYDLDKPLDSPGKWRYYQGSHFYAQHRCSDGQMQRMARDIQNYLNAPAKLPEAEIGPVVQVRLYASAADYRRNLKFSKYRDGHFNRRLNLIATYCDVSAVLLAEQLNLHALAAKPLRKWQRIFIAETMPMIARNKAQGAFADAEKDTPAGLMQVLLSNHWPGRSERATLRRLAIFLNDRKSLDQFIALLIEPATADDTGLEALEGLFPGELNAIAEAIGQSGQNAKANKTLRKGQTK